MIPQTFAVTSEHKIALSHCQSESPLTRGWHCRTTCDSKLQCVTLTQVTYVDIGAIKAE